jgi:putative transposase
MRKYEGKLNASNWTVIYAATLNGVEDHVHALFRLKTTHSIAVILEKVKGDSSAWINKKQFIPHHFNWQVGYGYFTLAKKDLDSVYKYIENQENHHADWTFLDEYRFMLDTAQVDYQDVYIFHPPI